MESDANTHAARLLDLLGLPQETLSRLQLSNDPDPAVDSSFRLGTAGQTSIGLSALAAVRFHELRTGVTQNVSVDPRHAVLEFKSENWYTIDGNLVGSGSIWDNIAGLYKTKDDNFVRIHTNFPHHRQGILDILKCEPTKESVAKALSLWNSFEFETVAADKNMCATAMRSFKEWDDHPQGKAIRDELPVSLRKIGEAPRRAVSGTHKSPLDGIRVLDLTRVLAGPVCGRTLAAHGADVLLVTSPKLPELPLIDIDTSRGKRTTQLDLTEDADRERFCSLLEDADVFLQAYRPGGLKDKGFGHEEVMRMRPGIVCANLTAWGWSGPWKDHRGFDSLVQTATGFNVAEGRAYASFKGEELSSPVTPRPLPMQALDHAAGYLLAFGINAALCKTITEGGSWEVRVSLAAVGQWIRSLGQLSPDVAFGQSRPLPPRILPPNPEIAALTIHLQRSQGKRKDDDRRERMTALRHSAMLEETLVREGEAPMVLDAHVPEWLPR